MSVRSIKDYIKQKHPNDPLLKRRFNQIVLGGGKTREEQWRFLFTGSKEEARPCNPHIARFMAETSESAV